MGWKLKNPAVNSWLEAQPQAFHPSYLAEKPLTCHPLPVTWSKHRRAVYNVCLWWPKRKTCLYRIKPEELHILSCGKGQGKTSLDDKLQTIVFNPLTAAAVHIRILHYLLAHYISAFEPVKDKKWHWSARFEILWPPFCQIWMIFTHLKLWMASARNNFRWVKIPIE